MKRVITASLNRNAFQFEEERVKVRREQASVLRQHGAERLQPSAQDRFRIRRPVHGAPAIAVERDATRRK